MEDATVKPNVGVFFILHEMALIIFLAQKRPIKQPQLQPSFHQKELVEISMNPSNNLLKYFELLFGHRKSREIQDQYKIGTLPEFNFGTVFWQIDNQNRVRGGKVIQYYENGKRTKYITWIHQFLKSKKQISEFNLSQCLFGLHLILGIKIPQSQSWKARKRRA